MLEQIDLIDANKIKNFIWPNNENAQTVRKWWEPIITNGTQHYIENIDVKPFVVRLGDAVLPIVVTTENYSNSWVCSPFAHYISYGQESVSLVGNKFASIALKKLLKGFGSISKYSKMNSVIYVNNWLFSTDLHSEETKAESLKALVLFFKNKYPSHAIVFRSLNNITNPCLINSLKTSGFSLLASRYVFVSDGNNESVFSTRILRSDLKLFKEAKYQLLQEVEVEECDKLLDLYHQLYVVNHSTLHPQFNKKYFKHLHNENLLQFILLKQGAEIKGMAGYYVRENVMMCPVFGYNKNTKDSNEIYRLLNTALLLESKKRGCLFNQSAGAAFFKSTRRAQGSMEYLAVYTRHLPKKQKIFWKALMFLMNKLGPKFMKNY